VQLQRLKATALDLRAATQQLKSAFAVFESVRTRPATPRLKSMVEAAESSCAVENFNRVVKTLPAKSAVV